MDQQQDDDTVRSGGGVPDAEQPSGLSPTADETAATESHDALAAEMAGPSGVDPLHGAPGEDSIGGEDVAAPSVVASIRETRDDWSVIDQASHVERRLPVRSAIGRILALYLGNLRTFALFGIPGGLVAGIANAGAIRPQGSPISWYGLLLLIVAVNSVTGLASVAAADEARAGRPVSARPALRRAWARTVAVLLSAVARVLLLGLLVFLLSAVVYLFARSGSTSISDAVSVPTIFYLVAAIAIALVVVVVVRWCASDAAIILEVAGPIEALGRSRELTRRNTIRVTLVYLAIGVIVMPLTIGSSFLGVVSGVPVIALALSIAAGIVTFPVLSITAATIFGDLSGRPVASAPTGASARLRTALAATWIILGIASLAVALPRYGAVAAQSILDRVPAADHGRIYAGTDRGPDPCHPLGAKAVFSASEPIIIGGYFTRIVPNGQSATIAFSVNGLELVSAPLASNGSLGCYYERNPLTGARTGTYRVTVTLQGETIAEGEFTVR